MRRFLVWSFLLGALLAVGWGCSDDDDNGVGPDNSGNRILVQSVTAPAGGETAVEIRTAHTATLLGVEVPLRVTGTGFFIDSVSYAGGLWEDCMSSACTIDSTENTVIMLSLDTVGVVAGEGLFATVYFSLPEAVAGDTIAIDTALIPVGGGLAHMISFETSALQTIYPAFQGGTIAIQEPVR
jgi:hypothetical protein